MLNEEYITGYQWSCVNNKFIGEYNFPNNKDKEEIHMPPFTTLKKPPVYSKGYIPYWNGNDWEVMEDPDVIKSHPPIENYEMLRSEYVEYLKSEDLWTEEDELQYSLALEKNRMHVHEMRSADEVREELEMFRDYWEEFRSIRNALLRLSDWTQLPDVVLTEEQNNLWDIYRQQLRDLPQNISDPKPLLTDLQHPSWPISPEGPIMNLM